MRKFPPSEEQYQALFGRNVNVEKRVVQTLTLNCACTNQK
jgi:hypothetical protein